MTERSAQKIDRKLLVVFGVLSIACGFGNCSQTAVNAMMSTMSAEYGISVAMGQWLSTGYILALGVAVPLTSFLTKRFSERFLLSFALGLQAAGSLLIMVAPCFELALVARVVQAAAVGLIMPAMQTMIMVDFPQEKMGTFMGIYGVAMGFMVNVGPTIGGAMEDAFGWRSFFVLQLVIAVVLLPLALRCARKAGSVAVRTSFDYLSYCLCGAGFVSLLLGCSNASNSGFGDVLGVWLPLLAGAALLALFVRRQLRLEEPFISMDIFKNAQFSWGFVITTLLFCAFVGVSLVIPLYVQGLRGGTALDAGLVMLPSSAVALVMNLGAGVAVDKIGARKVLVFSGSMLLLGALLALVCDENTPLSYVAFSQCVRAVGISGCIGPALGWALAGLPKQIVADGSSFITVARQASASFGTSLMVFLITAFLATGASAFAYQAAFALSAALSALTFILIVRHVR